MNCIMVTDTFFVWNEAYNLSRNVWSRDVCVFSGSWSAGELIKVNRLHLLCRLSRAASQTANYILRSY